MQWAIAAALICGASVLTSCSSNDDNPAIPDLNLSEKIIGKWIIADKDGQPALTNEKVVYNFISTTKAYLSLSFTDNSIEGTPWEDQREAIVEIIGNNITLTYEEVAGKTIIIEYHVEAISNTAMIAKRTRTIQQDGALVGSKEDMVRCEKQTADYRAAIVGTWQGRCTSEGSVFDDGQEHRWQYNADGTYVYYVKDGDNWVPNEGNTLNEYFVDGTLLCTRWIDQGQENREWWEITIADDKMNWTALRQNPDGTTFTATFEMEKVE